MSYEKKLKNMRKSAITDWIESSTNASVKDFDAIPFLDVLQGLWEVADKIRERILEYVDDEAFANEIVGLLVEEKEKPK